MTALPDKPSATSNYLNQPKRSEQEAMAEREDRKHRDALAELLEWLEHNDILSENAPGPDGFRSLRKNHIYAVRYAIEELTNAAAERIKGRRS